MASYDYVCSKCEYTWELNVPIDNRDKALSEPCPSCGEEDCIQRLIGSPIVNLSFRGSTIQSSSKAPTVLKEKLKRIKKSFGKDRCKGIEL